MTTTSTSKAPNVSRSQQICADLELLRERMEALRLHPSEVRRIESDVFRGLAACAGCESKAQCKKAPAVAQLRTANVPIAIVEGIAGLALVQETNAKIAMCPVQGRALRSVVDC